MVMCELGGFPNKIHLEDKDVRITLAPNSRAMGSEGSHGYGQAQQQHCFTWVSETHLLDGCTFVGDGLGGSNNNRDEVGHLVLGGSVDQKDSEHVVDNIVDVTIASEPPGEPIGGYNVPCDVGVNGTQASKAQTTFQKVSFNLPQYMLVSDRDSEEDQEDDLFRCSDDTDSSYHDWILA